MPKYCYYCESCKIGYEVVHSIKERLKKCEFCNARALRIIPSIPAYLKTKKLAKKEKKTGSVVEEYIEKNRESVKQEKERLKNQEYKNE
jgi:predicted nucleic acid-binding Zn ribbon protein